MKKVNIKVSAYEATIVDSAVKKIVQFVETKDKSVKISGPVPLPTRRERFTILKSVHVNKKSREQFEIRTHKRMVVLTNPSDVVMDGLKRLEIPVGVEVRLVTK